MATFRRSPGARPRAGAGTTRRPSNRTSRTATRPGHGAARARTNAETGLTTSAGLKATPVTRSRVPRSAQRPSVTGRAAVLAFVLAVLLVSYAYPLRTWFEQRGERAHLTEEAAQLQQSVRELEREQRLWDDPGYVALLARERLSFVMPGEQGYVVIPDPADGQAEAAVDQDGIPPLGNGEWYERLWTSVQAADAEDGQ